MKKLTILIIILTLAASANAMRLQISVNGEPAPPDTEITLMPSDTLELDIYSPDGYAPGDDVYSSVMGGGYEAWDGTSMATPIVSGVAALVLEKYPDITLADLAEELLSTCEDLDLPADRQGAGLVQVQTVL